MSYDDSIPAASHSGSQDYFQMQQNFAQIQNSFKVNHEPFASGGVDGYHTQIQLAAPVSDPGKTGTVSSIYTKGSPPNLFFQNVSSIFQLTGPISNIANGYIVVNGVYFQWGHRVIANTLPVPFNINFPNACFVVLLTSDSTSSQFNVTSLLPNQFSWAANPIGNAQFYWFAIGN